MSESEAVPSEWNAFSGMSCAVGATKWMMPITMVPWPKALYCEFPSSIAAEDWSSIAADDWFTCAGAGHVVELQGGGVQGEVDANGHGERSLSSEPPAWFRVKSKPSPGTNTGCSTGCVGSTPVSMSATIPSPVTLNAFCAFCTPTIDAAG